MPQYGPFVEVFCETYVHHAVLNLIVISLIVLCVLVTSAVAIIVHRITKKQ